MPTGVAVVTVDAGAQRVGLTVATLMSLSLDPPLVGVAISRQAAAHELRSGGPHVRDLAARGRSASSVAEHFARGVPPIAMWHGVATRDGMDGAPLLEPAPLGWLECARRDELETGSHTLFVLGGGPGRARH